MLSVLCFLANYYYDPQLQNAGAGLEIALGSASSRHSFQKMSFQMWMMERPAMS